MRSLLSTLTKIDTMFSLKVSYMVTNIISNVNDIIQISTMFAPPYAYLPPLFLREGFFSMIEPSEKKEM